MVYTNVYPDVSNANIGVKNMTTETIEISVSKPLAQKFKNSPESEKLQVCSLFHMLLSRLQSDKRSIEKIAKQATKTAKERGLTREMLNEILNEE